MRKIIAVVFFVIFIAINGYSQEIISASGSSSTIQGYEISWTLGEPVISTYTNSSIILTQGFHQTRLIITSVDEIKIAGLKLSVYPNPTFEKLNIKTDKNPQNIKLKFKLLGMDSKVITEQNIENSLFEVDMHNLASGSYFVSIQTSEGEPVQVFKVLKK